MDTTISSPSDDPAAQVSGKRVRLLAGAGAGAFAGLLASALMLWLARAWDGVPLAQLLSDRLTWLVPVELFGAALGALESNAKALTLALLTLLQVAGGAAAGALYAAIVDPDAPRRWRNALLLAVGGWLLLALVAAPLGQAGVFARDAPEGAWPALAIFALSAALFGALVAALVPAPSAGPEVNPARRRALATLCIGLPALLSASYVGNRALAIRSKAATLPSRIEEAPAVTPVDGSSTPPAAPTGFQFAGMPLEITPTSEFYVVSKNFDDPEVDGAAWSLVIEGRVDRPLDLSRSDVLARPASKFTSTLECISNPVGGDYISTAVWQGFPLAELLAEAGLGPGVVDLELHAADGYVESIPLSEALAPDTMLVHTMNGEPLDDRHGAPLRLIVPGIFGMKNVKWLERIVAVDHDVFGFWQERGWSDVATVVTMSRIDTPRHGAKVIAGQPFRAGGIAFAGDRGIERVEVSFDERQTWREAALSAPLSPLSWRLWALDHTPLETGRLTLTVRAIDGSGATQWEDEAEPLPDGATGWHEVQIPVRAVGE